MGNGHITGAYPLGLSPRPSGHSPIGERRIRPKRYIQLSSRLILRNGKGASVPTGHIVFCRAKENFNK
jgi:hypothetical protein